MARWGTGVPTLLLTNERYSCHTLIGIQQEDLMETEKVCVNLSAAELGHLDILVAEGVYVSRTDAVRAALRREFALHQAAIDRHLKASETGTRASRPDRVVTGFSGIGFSRL